MLKNQMWSLLLILYAKNLEAFLVSPGPDPTTVTPTDNATTASGVTMGIVKKDDNLTKVGEEIINVAMKIREIVEDWNAIMTASTTNEDLSQKVDTVKSDINIEGSLVSQEPDSTTETLTENAPTAAGVTMDTVKEDNNRTKVTEEIINLSTEANKKLEASSVSQESDPITVTPTENAATNSGVTIEIVMEGDNRTKDGKENISVATEIYKYEEDWRTTMTAWTTNEGLTQKVDHAEPNMSLDASLVSLKRDPTTVIPTRNVTTSGGVTIEIVKVDNNKTNVTMDFMNMSTEFHQFVEVQSTSLTAWTTDGVLSQKVEVAKPNKDQTGRLGGERVDQVSEIKEGNWSGSDLNLSINNGTTASPCFPVPSDWPICKQSRFFTLPNIFNHTSVEEVGATLKEWAWLVWAGCHHSTEWFLCLLLAPRCASPSVPFRFPCQSFCFVLQDSCWAFLENGSLPVECHLLPEQVQEPERPACASVNNRKGNPGGLKCILCIDTFQIQSHFSFLILVCLLSLKHIVVAFLCLCQAWFCLKTR